MTQPGWNQQSPWQNPGQTHGQGQQPAGWSYGAYQPVSQPSQPGYQPAQPGYQPYQSSQQWGPPGTQPVGGQAHRRKSPLRWVIGALIAVVAIGFVALIITSVTGGTSGTYQNDDYAVPPPDLSPPPLPKPASEAEAKQMTEQNAIYDQILAQPVRCEAPRIDDVTTATDAELQEHFGELTACLTRTWGPMLEQAGFAVVRPTVTIYGKSIDTGCGEIDFINAVYCGVDQQVYYSRDLLDLLPEVEAKNSVVVDFVLAHEFGHAIQGRSGILYARVLLQQNAASKPAALELNRRLEVQADCFSGMFMRATAQSSGLTQADVPTIRQGLRAVGDAENRDGDHGKADNREFWGLTGFATDRVGTCNTFVAPAEQVR